MDIASSLLYPLLLLLMLLMKQTFNGSGYCFVVENKQALVIPETYQRFTQQREQMEKEKEEENRRERNRSGDDDDTDCEGSKAKTKADSTAVVDDDADIPPRREKYDVFISFRGEDTRLGITSHLHAALLQKKIKTYIDNRLQRGEEIGPALLEAIEKSTISVIIFSQNYASSTWCLGELVHILKCKEIYGQMVVPVFYDINPSDVRKQNGSYADAFAQLEKRLNDSIDKVHKWRGALKTATNLSGFDYSNKSE